MFPIGAPGVALLLMRISVAVMLVSDESGHLLSPASPVFVILVVLAVALCIGFITPIVALLSCLFEVVALLSLARGASLVLALPILNALALALLGPGAYSLDARLFGRRRLVFGSRTDEKAD